MAFFRKRGLSVTLIHGVRTPSGVRQKILHTFPTIGDLHRLLENGGWPKFRMEMEQQFPDIAPDWEDAHRQALALEPATQEHADTSVQLEKLRKAMSQSGKELSRLDPRQDTDRRVLLALGPELKELLLAGQFLLDSARGRDPQSARELARLMVPNAECLYGIVERAEQALAASNWKRAARLFQQAREYDPFDPDTINSEGIGWLNRDRLVEAQDCFERAKSLAFQQLPQGDRVYSWSNLRARPYLRAIFNLALTHERKGEYARALELFQERLQRCPENADAARAQIGTLHHHLGDFEAALRYYRKVLKEGADVPDTHFDGASALIGLGREAEAIAWILRGLSINMHIPRALKTKYKPDHAPYGEAGSWEWACNYSAHKRELWSPSAQAFLKRVAREKTVRMILEDMDAIQSALEEVRPSAKRSTLVAQLFDWRERLASPDFANQISASLFP